MGGGRGGGGGGLYDDDSNVEAPEGGNVPSDSPWVWLVEYYAPWWVGLRKEEAGVQLHTTPRQGGMTSGTG